MPYQQKPNRRQGWSPHFGVAWRAWYRRSRSIQASRHRPYEVPPKRPHELLAQSSLQRAPSRVWAVNCGVAHAANTTGVSAMMNSRLMRLSPRIVCNDPLRRTSIHTSAPTLQRPLLHLLPQVCPIHMHILVGRLHPPMSQKVVADGAEMCSNAPLGILA